MGYLRLEEAWQMVKHYFPGVSVTGEQVSNPDPYGMSTCRELAEQPAIVGILAEALLMLTMHLFALGTARL